MEDIVISICIPVYNQINIVKECVKRILKSKSNKFEIVINDDCSDEPIKEMIHEIDDDRLKYYCNVKNLGHDRNILASFLNAKSKYVFLLRSRDFLLPTGLEKIINLLETNDNNDIAYLTTSAYDSNMIPKLVYNNQIYNKGRDALMAHQKLYVHPSGSVYNVSLMNIEQLNEYLVRINASKRNFTVHSLIRAFLATKGDFVTCDFFSWIYSDTNEATDIATNKGLRGESVYDTKYQIERYGTEMGWVSMVLPDDLKDEEYIFLFSFYLYACTWNNKLVYKNRKMSYHYNFERKRISCTKERNIFLKEAMDLETRLDIKNPEYYRKRKKALLKNMTIDAIKYCVERLKNIMPLKKEIKAILYGDRCNLRRTL